jgi:hypothetical protein
VRLAVAAAQAPRSTLRLAAALALLAACGKSGPDRNAQRTVAAQPRAAGPASVSASVPASVPANGDSVTTFAIRQIKPLDETIDEEWQREIAEPRMRDIQGVSATKIGRQKWPWNATVAIMEFVRDTPLEVTLRERIMSALRTVPGVIDVAEDDRERWVLRGDPSGKALVEAVAVVVDELAPQTSAEYDQ